LLRNPRPGSFSRREAAHGQKPARGDCLHAVGRQPIRHHYVTGHRSPRPSTMRIPGDETRRTGAMTFWIENLRYARRGESLGGSRAFALGMDDAQRTTELIRRNRSLLARAKEARDQAREAARSADYALALVWKRCGGEGASG